MGTGKSLGTSRINKPLSENCYCLNKSNGSKSNGLKGASGCIFTTCNKGQLSGKICQSSYLSVWKKIKPGYRVVIALYRHNPNLSLTSIGTYLPALLCSAHEALGKATLISLPLTLLMPSFPESSIFILLVIVHKLKKKKKWWKYPLNKVQTWDIFNIEKSDILLESIF